MMRCVTRVVGLFFAALVSSAAADELLLNGTFESAWTNGWTKGSMQDPAGAIQNQSGHFSPFTNINPGGTSALQLTGWAGSGFDYGPSIFQSLTAPSSYQFSFEFSLPNVTAGVPWELGVGNSGSPIIDFMIGGSGGYGSNTPGHIAYSTTGYNGSDYTDIANLMPGIWYQIVAFINRSAGTFSGTLTPYQGAPIAFSGALPAGSAPGGANGRSVIMGATGQPAGAVIYVDNVSVRSVPEPGVCEFLAGVSVSFWMRRRYKNDRGESVAS